jgi:hypothetical protein
MSFEKPGQDPAQEENEKPKVEAEPHIAEFQEILAPFLEEDVFEALHAITEGDEARESEERESAKEALGAAHRKLQFLGRQTDIEDDGLEGLIALNEQHRVLLRAVGQIVRGEVDHTLSDEASGADIASLRGIPRD